VSLFVLPPSPRPGTARALRTAAAIGFVLLAPGLARAICNVIPVANERFRGAQGEVSRPFASPGDEVGLTALPGICDPAADGALSLNPDDWAAVVIFTPPSGARHAVATVSPGGCADPALVAQMQACSTALGGTVPSPRASCVEVPVNTTTPPTPGRLRIESPSPGTATVPRTLVFPFPRRAVAGGADDTASGPATLLVVPRTASWQCGVAATPASRCAKTGEAGRASTRVCVDDLFALERGCGATSDDLGATFASFTAMPVRNDFASLCTGSGATGCANPGAAPPIRFTLDRLGNALVPFDYSGARAYLERAGDPPGAKGLPVPRIGRIAMALPSGGEEARRTGQALTVAIRSAPFVSSHADSGVLLPPVFTPLPGVAAPGDPPGAAVLFGLFDGDLGVVRVARRSPARKECLLPGNLPTGRPCAEAADCGGLGAGVACADAFCRDANGAVSATLCKNGSCAGRCGPDLYDLSALAGAGPLQVTSSRVDAGRAVSFDVEQTPSQFSFVVPERVDAERVNRDLDAVDLTVTRFNRASGVEEPLRSGAAPPPGRAVSRFSLSSQDVPAVAAEGDLLAFFESETQEDVAGASAAGGDDLNGDGDRLDAVVRAFQLGSTTDLLGSIPLAQKLVAFPTPLVGDRPLQLTDGILYFLTSERMGTRTTVRSVSVRNDGSEPTQTDVLGLLPTSSSPSLSDSGRFVAFQSDAIDLVSTPDLNGTPDIFVHDRDFDGDGVFDEPGAIRTVRVSDNPLGESGSPGGWPIEGSGFDFPVSGSLYPSISSNGRFVVFTSLHDDLTDDDASDGNGAADVFVRDRDADLDGVFDEPTPQSWTYRISLRDDGFPPTPLTCPAIVFTGGPTLDVQLGAEYRPKISGDGRFVFFTTYYRDLVFPDSVSQCGTPQVEPLQGPSETDDEFAARLTNAFARFAQGVNGADAVLLDAGLGTLERINVRTDGTTSQDSSFASLAVGFNTPSDPLISEAVGPFDMPGRFVVFESLARLDPTNDAVLESCPTLDPATGQPLLDQNGNEIPRDCLDVYVRDRLLGTTTLVSRPHLFSVTTDGDSVAQSMTRDGKVIVFASDSEQIALDDQNGAADLFSFDQSDPIGFVRIARESVSLSGAEATVDPLACPPSQGASASSFPGLLSPDGRELAFFSQATNLSFEDVDCASNLLVRARTTGAVERLVSQPVRRVASLSMLDRTPNLREIVYSDCDPTSGDCSDTSMSPRTSIYASSLSLADPVNAARDLNADGDLSDGLLQAVDLRQSPPQIVSLPAGQQVSVFAGAAAFLRPEIDLGGSADVDLNADGDAIDLVVHLFRGRNPAAPTQLLPAADDLGLAATGVALSGGWVAALEKEGQGLVGGFATVETLLGDTARPPAEGELALWRRATSGPWLRTGRYADSLRIVGDLVAFITPESPGDLYIPDTDIDADGDTDDRFIHLLDANTGQLDPRLEAANGGPFQAEELVFEGDLIAFRSRECRTALDPFGGGCPQPTPGCDLNGDFDCDDEVLRVLDLQANRGPYETGLAVTPCSDPACEPGVPYRVKQRTVRALVDEQQQGQDLDLANGANDLLVVLWRPPAPAAPGGSGGSSSVVSTVSRELQGTTAGASPVPVSQVGVSVDPLGEAVTLGQTGSGAQALLRPGLCKDSATGATSEPEQSCDLDADCGAGRVCDLSRLASVGIADADADGIPDTLDNCRAVPNADQLDTNADGFGDACDRCGLDTDVDGKKNCADNCPTVANADQLDRGGVGSGSPADGVGDACQCGDVSGDGRVTVNDSVLVTRSLLTPPTATLAKPGLCDVGGSAGCTVSDAVVIRRALLTPPTATIAPKCASAAP
jgi:hypothetical protein